MIPSSALQQGMWLLLVSSHQVGQKPEQTRSQLVVWSAPATVPRCHGATVPRHHHWHPVTSCDHATICYDMLRMGWWMPGWCRWNLEGSLTKHIQIRAKYIIVIDHKIPTELVSPELYLQFRIDTIYFCTLFRHICCGDSENSTHLCWYSIQSLRQ